MLQSARLKINYPDPLRTDSADVPRDFGSIITWLDGNAMGYGQGTLAARPTSTSGTPGQQGRVYVATDQAPHQVFYDYGTGWDAVGAITPSAINQQGTLTLRPGAGTVAAGTKYFATDQVVEYISDGVSWARVGLPAGHTTDWFHDTVVPTGYVLYDGNNLASAVGIYADLYAHLGSVLATPDTRGRHTVSRGTHADVDHVLDNDGGAVGSRRPRHKHGHTLTLPDHVHPPNPGDLQGVAGSIANTINNSGGSGSPNVGYGIANTGNPSTHPAINGVVGQNTGSELTDSGGFITAVKIAKL